MRKIFCDCCEEEISGAPNTIEIPCHLHSLKGKCGYVDNQWNEVSGRKDVVELCNSCNNRVYGAAVKAIEKIKEERLKDRVVKMFNLQ